MTPSDLEKLIDKETKKHRVSTTEEKDKIFGYLNGQLKENYDPDGTVVSLLVYDKHGKINQYGRYIKPEVIFDRLNLSISGKNGTAVTGHISYPELPRLTSYKKGYFVEAKRYLVHAKAGENINHNYVALVGIPINPEEQVYHYPRNKNKK